MHTLEDWLLAAVGLLPFAAIALPAILRPSKTDQEIARMRLGVLREHQRHR